MPDNSVVAVGFLTQNDLRVLGDGFRRYTKVEHGNDMFADLLAKLDQIEAVPLGRGVTLMPRRK